MGISNRHYFLELFFEICQNTIKYSYPTFQRIQLLYRPGESLCEIRNSSLSDRSRTEYVRGGGNGAVGNLELNSYQAQDDAPPKYTPPPSYTTATGARFAKILRQSIRRSVRR